MDKKFKRTVYNIGYLGIGINPSENKKAYIVWKSMLRRCYDEKHLLKYKTYIGCTVDERWHNFQVFAKWYEQNYIDGFQLDKDILIKGNKVYSPDTCCFVPVEINNMFKDNITNIGIYPNGKNLIVRFQRFGKTKNFGTYKYFEEAQNILNIEKEKYFKEVAEIWKNKIHEKVYQILIETTF